MTNDDIEALLKRTDSLAAGFNGGLDPTDDFRKCAAFIRQLQSELNALRASQTARENEVWNEAIKATAMMVNDSPFGSRTLAIALRSLTRSTQPTERDKAKKPAITVKR